MDWLSTLLLGILAGLLVPAILAILGCFKNSRPIKRLSGSRIFGHGVECCYPNQKEALPDILKSMEESNQVCIYTMRGNSFSKSDGDFRPFVTASPHRSLLLLADPGDDPADNPHLAERAMEFPGSPSPEDYRQKVISSARDILAAQSQGGKVQCRLHRQAAFCRLCLCDNVAYLAIFENGKAGNQLPIFRIRRGTPLFLGLRRLFDIVWNDPTTRDLSELNVK